MRRLLVGGWCLGNGMLCGGYKNVGGVLRDVCCLLRAVGWLTVVVGCVMCVVCGWCVVRVLCVVGVGHSVFYDACCVLCVLCVECCILRGVWCVVCDVMCWLLIGVYLMSGCCSGGVVWGVLCVACRLVCGSGCGVGWKRVGEWWWLHSKCCTVCDGRGASCGVWYVLYVVWYVLVGM